MIGFEAQADGGGEFGAGHLEGAIADEDDGAEVGAAMETPMEAGTAKPMER